jgi:hypothetical protein
MSVKNKKNYTDKENKMFDYRMWAYISFYSKERQQEYINKLIYEIEGKI